MVRKEFGQFISDRRKSLNLSQKDIADRLMTSPQTISNWERALFLPEFSILGLLANALKLSFSDLINMNPTDASTYVEETRLFNITSFAKNLQFLRKYHNLSQTDLAKKLNSVNYATISNWEREIGLPSLAQLKELATILELPI